MQIKISKKNTKLGKVPNISMPPGITCIPDIPCLSEGCYALKSYRQYPNVENAWMSNYEFYKMDPAGFLDQWKVWMDTNHPDRFRIFVGGDIPDKEFWQLIIFLTEYARNTDFLMFTKKYQYIRPDDPINSNLQVVLSVWPGHPLPLNRDLPWAWLEEDVRRPSGLSYIRCPGGCEECHHKCWNVLDKDLHVVFPKH